MNRKHLVFAVVGILGVALDQVSKYWVRTSPDVNAPGGIKVIPHFFSIVHAENPGAAFGMLGSLSTEWRIAIFVGFTLIATGIVWDLYRRLSSTDWFLSSTLALILSGAWGNAIDRIFKPIYGDEPTVTDFLRFYTDDPGWAEWLRGMFGMAEYPSFNIADANLFIGVGMFLIHYLFLESDETPGAEPKSTGAPTDGAETPDDPDTDEATA